MNQEDIQAGLGNQSETLKKLHQLHLIPKVAEEIIDDYDGVVIGGKEYEVMTEQLFFRICRVMRDAFHGEIATDRTG